MTTLGKHVLLDLHNCDRAKLDDLPYLREAMLAAAGEVGATVIDHIFHQFSPQGVTGVVAIAESHLCIHTWPEHGYAAVDIFTCGDGFDPTQAADFLVERLGCVDPNITEVRRGMLTPAATTQA